MMMGTTTTEPRRVRPLPLAAVLLTAAALGAAPRAALAYYTVTPLGNLGGTGGSPSPTGINASGQISGSMPSSASGANDAFLYSNGKLTDLGSLPGATGSVGNGINVNGQVVGTSGGQAFIATGTTLTGLGTLGGSSSYGNGINGNGQVVGYSNTAAGAYHAFIFSAGTMTDIGSKIGGSFSLANAINDSGQVTGYSNATGITQAFLYNSATGQTTNFGGSGSAGNAINVNGEVVGISNNAGGVQNAFAYYGGAMHDLGTLGGTSQANGVNDLGQVVGNSNGAGFLYSNGAMTNLNTLLAPNSGWTITAAYAINDNGWIAATGSYNGGATQAVELSLPVVAVAEPKALALLSGGLALGLGLRRFSQRRKAIPAVC